LAKIVLLKEASQQTGLSYGELYNGVRSGKYPGYRVGTSKHGKWVTDLELLNAKIIELMNANIKEDSEPVQYGQLRRVGG
jgi:hypothetical protein